MSKESVHHLNRKNGNASTYIVIFDFYDTTIDLNRTVFYHSEEDDYKLTIMEACKVFSKWRKKDSNSNAYDYAHSVICRLHNKGEYQKLRDLFRENQIRIITYKLIK